MNRSNYEAAKLEADRRDISIAGLVELGLEALGVPVVKHTQQPLALVNAITARKARRASERAAATRNPSRERQLLGDEVADVCGFS
jgi:hypothetical protein